MHDCIKNANKISVVKLEVKRPLVRLQRRRDDNIKMDKKYCGWSCEVLCVCVCACVCVPVCRLEWRFVAKKYWKVWFHLRYGAFDQSGGVKFIEGRSFPQT